jgi:hypothetical protein
MSMRPRAVATAIAAALGLGCNRSPEIATPTAPVLAARAKVDQDTRARYSFADSVNVGTALGPQWVPAGFRGDNRLRDGSPSGAALSNEYQGDFCGSNAVIGSGAGGQTTDLNYDPDMHWSTSLPGSCQPARYYRVYLNGPSAAPGNSSPHEIVGGIATMTVGESRIQSFQSGTLGDLGVGLHFDAAYPPASNIMVTRLANVIDEFGRSVRQWRVETQGSHRAMGFVSGRHGLVPTGITYYLPFSMTVTEVPYPFPTYP